MAKSETDTLIIGAGPSGLAVGACLRKRDVPFVMIEKADAVGASWRNHYERLHLHTMKEHSSLPYVPFPEDAPRYVPRAQVVDYLEDYARRFALKPHLGETVERAEFISRRWNITTDQDTYISRRLIVASGYNHIPRIPDWPERESYAGEVIHSSAYRNGKSFAGKRVLVVGAGNSGAEIALDLFESGAHVTMCIRSPTWVVPRDTFGLIPSQLTGLTMAKLPIKLADFLAGTIIKRVVGDLSRYGIQTPRVGPVSQVQKLGKVPLIDIGTLDLIKQGKIEVVGAIDRYVEDGVVLEAGGRVACDVVLCATGYRAALERFLPDAPRLVDERGYPRWFGREAIIPGLYFVGFRNPIDGFLHDVAREALRVADDIAAKQA